MNKKSDKKIVEDVEKKLSNIESQELIPEEKLNKMMDESINSNEKERISENQKMSANQTPIEDARIKRFKLFFVSDMDEEAKYLHDMSKKGFHFMGKESVYYLFNNDEPRNYYYHLSYHEKDKNDNEHYLSIYEDVGWKNVYHEKAEFDGVWNYFRIEIGNEEEEPNIYSDRVSCIALYKRLLNNWKSLLAMVAICFLFMLFISYFLFTHPSAMTSIFIMLSSLIILVIMGTFFIYLRAYMRIHKKLEELLKF